MLVAGKERLRAERGRDAQPGPGPDFILDPVLSPDGAQIAWLQWDHPHLSWDETTLWLGRLGEAGDLLDARSVAGGAGESLEQPTWLGATLLVLSDRSGWSNLYRVDPDRQGQDALTAVTEGELELGEPRWVPDTRSYAPLPDGRVVSARTRDGFRELVVVDPSTGGTTSPSSPRRSTRCSTGSRVPTTPSGGSSTTPDTNCGRPSRSSAGTSRR